MTGRKPNNIKLTTFLWFMCSTELDTSRYIRGQQYDHLCSFTCPSFINKKKTLPLVSHNHAKFQKNPEGSFREKYVGFGPNVG